VFGLFVEGGVTLVVPVDARAITARVFGPTAPYPVVFGVPLEAIPFRVWYCCTAASVKAPK
jgi:hypothetical protein